MKGDVAVVLARAGDGRTLGPSLDGFLREVRGRGEVILVGGPAGVASRPALRILDRPSARLVPELWRDGLREADAEFVAFSTTQMVPRDGWLDALLGRLDGPGVGGAIASADGLGPLDRAVYLQRHLPYAPEGRLPTRPSGENALYRRRTLIEVEDSWSDGFWEAEVHPRLERLGATWSRAPEGVVEFVGSTRFDAIIRQRLSHARRLGAVRASGWGPAGRCFRILAAPAVPLVLLARVANRLATGRMMKPAWAPAVPAFVALAAAWALGEAIGTWTGSATPERG